MFESVLDPIFSPLLKIQPIFSIAIIAFIVTVIITLIHKFTTDQKKMKEIKEEMKSHQNEMKKCKNDPKKMMDINKKVMEKNMEFMKHSLKPMLFSFLPIIIIFGWLNTHMVYYPIMPEQEFDITLTFDPSAIGKDVALIEIIPPEGIDLLNSETQKIESLGIKKTFGTNWVGSANFKLEGLEGKYTIRFEYEGRNYEKDVLITEERRYEEPELKVNDGTALKSIKVGNEPIKPFFGIGWLGTYIIFAIVFSMALRKILNIV
ncbi:MAG: EMC3/TMCO1 family protein [Candidatus Nanoarchaeia archaeon]|nr:EMC3/TMCO1 family protein [Candidatus Nanoarchaeia archaeon]